MKKFFAILSAMLLAGAVFADGVSQYEDQSAEYGRTLNRNASIGVDSAYYNPAGTAFMPNGMYVAGGTDIIIQNVTAKGVNTGSGAGTYGEGELDLERNSFIPYFARAMFVWKQDQMAVSVAVVPFAGGGFTVEGDTAKAMGAEYVTSAYQSAVLSGYTKSISKFLDDNDYVIDEVSVTKIYAGPQANFAYALNEMFAVGVGVRYARLFGTYETTSDNDALASKTTYSGNIFGGVFSVDAMPMKELNIAAKFEYFAKHEETESSDQDGVDDVTTESMIPPKFGLGIAYYILPELKAEVSFNYYLNSMVEYDDDGDSSTDDYKLSDDYDNGMEYGIAFEYMVMPELTVSLGYLYTDLGQKDTDAFGLTSNDINFSSIGAGASYKAMEGLTVDVGFVYEIYDSAITKQYVGLDVDSPEDHELSKSQYVISIGVTYAIDGGAIPTSMEDAEAMQEDAEGKLGDAKADAEAKADDIDVQ